MQHQDFSFYEKIISSPRAVNIFNFHMWEYRCRHGNEHD